jgi:hypothetical protein
MYSTWEKFVGKVLPISEGKLKSRTWKENSVNKNYN